MILSPKCFGREWQWSGVVSKSLGLEIDVPKLVRAEVMHSALSLEGSQSSESCMLSELMYKHKRKAKSNEPEWSSNSARSEGGDV